MPFVKAEIPWESINNGINTGVVDVVLAKDEFNYYFANGKLTSSDNNFGSLNYTYLANSSEFNMLSSRDDIIVVENYGLRISTDNGKNWNYYPYIIDLSSNEVKIYDSKLNDDTIYLVSSDDVSYLSKKNGTWLNQEFNSILNFDTSLSYSSIGFNLNTVFVGTNLGKILILDDRKNWVENKDLPISKILSIVSINGFTFVSSKNNGIYYSSNLGKSWNKITHQLVSKKSFKSLYVHKNTIYACTFGNDIYTSIDNGLNWNLLKIENFIDDFNTISSNNFQVVIGTKGNGIYKSTDDGISWQNKNCSNLRVSNIMNSNTELYVIAESSLYYSGVFYSSDNGLNWINRGLHKENISSLAVYENEVYALSQNALFYSSNKGISWEKIEIPNIYTIDKSSKCYNTIKKINNKIYLLLNTNGYLNNDFAFYISSDNGKYWITHSQSEDLKNVFYDVTVRDSNIYLGYNYGVIISNDEGKTYKKVILSDFSRVNTIAFNDKIGLIGTNDNLQISKDNGKTWMYKAFRGNWINHILMYKDFVFMGYNKGIAVSSDNGETWKYLGLTEFNVNRIAVSGDYIFATTENNGVFRSRLSDIK
ncbi:MAG: hypothetical protein NTW25_14040 [Candidatus Kapabacteria bacterium]|nr:hypothetical protein [Candidatus Kapabacteria bacterium]